MLKKTLLLGVTLSLFLLGAAKAPRVTEISGKTSKINALAIVVPQKNPVVNAAAAELQKFLSEATGTRIPVVNHPQPGKFSIVLGDNPLLKKAGLDVTSNILTVDECIEEIYKLCR